jgi:hypothetical protein
VTASFPTAKPASYSVCGSAPDRSSWNKKLVQFFDYWVSIKPAGGLPDRVATYRKGAVIILHHKNHRIVENWIVPLAHDGKTVDIVVAVPCSTIETARRISSRRSSLAAVPWVPSSPTATLKPADRLS